MTDAVATPTETVKQRAPAANFLPIVSGKLPQLFVHAIRFRETGSNSEIAKRYATSVGKVFDIKKGRNFSYITEDWKPTQADVDAAQGWIKRLNEDNKHGLSPQGDANHMETVTVQYLERGLATAEEVMAQDATRASTRAPRKPRAAKAEASSGSQSVQDDLVDLTADDLLE